MHKGKRKVKRIKGSSLTATIEILYFNIDNRKWDYIQFIESKEQFTLKLALARIN